MTTRILVTGAAGFIGRALVARLVQAPDVAVRAWVHRTAPPSWPDEVELLRGDLLEASDRESATADVDAIIHLAASLHDPRSREDRDLQRRISVDGSAALFEAARARGVRRFVFVSSLAVYGGHSDAVRTEEDPCDPEGAYGTAKLEAEERLAALAREGGPELTILRPASVYGPGAEGPLLRMLHWIEGGRFPPPPPVDGRRSFVHVDNLVEACVLAASSPRAAGATYIVTDGTDLSTREIYEQTMRHLGRTPGSRSIPLWCFRLLAWIGEGLKLVVGRPMFFHAHAYRQLFGSARFSSARIEGELGYSPRSSFGDALAGIFPGGES